MTQIFVNLLNSLKKANAAAKQKMAEKNGFSTPEEFEKYLLKQIKRKLKTEVGRVEVTKPLTKEELKLAKKVKVKAYVKPKTKTLVDKVKVK